MDVPEEDNTQKSKRASIQMIMNDTTLTPQEKQLKIQAFMASGGKSVASTASVGSTTTAPTSNRDPLPPLPTAPTHYPRLLLLISRQTIDREQKNQGVIETVIKGANLGEPEIVDGADEANVKRREELFAISGLQAKYPQVFLLESASAKPQFLGDSQGVQDMNEKGKFTKNAILGIEEEKEEDKENEPPADAASKATDAAVAPKTISRAAPTESGRDRSIDLPPKSKGLFCCFGSKNKTSTPPPAPTPNAATRSAPTAAKASTPAPSQRVANSSPKAGPVPAASNPPAPAPAPAPTPPPKATPPPVPAPKAAPKTTDSTSPFGNKPLKRTTPPPAAAPKTTDKNANPFGAKPLKSTPTPAPSTPKSADKNAKPFGNVALKSAPKPAENRAPKKTESKPEFAKQPLKKTPQPAAATRAPPPSANKPPAQTSRGVSGNYNKKAAPPSNTKNSKSRAAAPKKKPSPKPKQKATITRVQPSDSHPAGTWYTKTTFQRLFGR